MQHPIRLVILGQQYTFLLIIYSLLSLILMLIKAIYNKEKNIIMFEDKSKKACPNHFLLCHK